MSSSPYPRDYDERLGAPTYIYGLCDPDTHAIRYIGKSTRPLERFRNHMNDRSRCHRTNWLQSLKTQGKEPILVVLEMIHGEWPWQESERFWIRYGKAQGWPLINGTSGGDGVPDLSSESRARVRATWIGRRHSEHTKALIGAASRSRRHTDETRQRMSRAQTGRTILWVDKIKVALRKLSDEAVRQIVERLAGGERTTDLAREFGVHRTTLSKIKTGTYYGQR